MVGGATAWHNSNCSTNIYHTANSGDQLVSNEGNIAQTNLKKGRNNPRLNPQQ